MIIQLEYYVLDINLRIKLSIFWIYPELYNCLLKSKVYHLYVLIYPVVIYKFYSEDGDSHQSIVFLSIVN